MNLDNVKPLKFKYGKQLPPINNPSLGIGSLFALMFLMLGIVSVASALIARGDGIGVSQMRLLTVAQNLFVFFVPAILSAIIVTKLPATLLRLDVKIKVKPLLMSIIIMILAAPALDWVIRLNESITLPESLHGLEETLRASEQAAQSAVMTMIGGDTIIDLIISILLVGVLTGVCEEMFFRGALQNLFFSTKMRRHAAIWLAAILFSAMHLQFYGFIPRVLLGAFFGYTMWWTGSVWTPVILHALNNSMAVILSWAAIGSETAAETTDSIEQTISFDAITIALSFLVTGIGIYILRRMCIRDIKYNRLDQ